MIRVTERRRCLRGGLALLLAATACAIACGDARPGRVLLVGIDGASPAIVDRLLADGRLPHLAELADEGVYGPLRSFSPYFSPRIWNSIATGKTPDRHGILFFGWLDEQKQFHLYQSMDRKVPALWNVVSDAGRSVAVVNWMNTYPPEKVNGVMVSAYAIVGLAGNRDPAESSGDVATPDLTYPESWQERAAALIADPTPLTDFPRFFEENPALPDWSDAAQLARVQREDDAAVRTALAIEAEIHPDLLLLYLPGIDRVSHRLWGSVQPEELFPERLRPSASEREAGAAALLGYYDYTDALIGPLVERFGERDLVLVVSDHGFETPRYKGAFLTSNNTGTHWTHAAQDGVIFARGRSVSPGRLEPDAVTVNDITPTILAWLGMPRALDMDGQPAPFLGSVPEETVASYDATPIERPVPPSQGAEREMLERLRAMGYLE